MHIITRLSTIILLIALINVFVSLAVPKGGFKAPKIKIKVGGSGGQGSSNTGGGNQGQGQGQANTLAQKLVFCGAPSNITRGQASTMYYRFQGIPFAVNWDAIQPQLGLRLTTAPAQSPLIMLREGTDYSIKKAEKGFFDASMTGVIQNAVLGYGCVDGKPSDIGEWYVVTLNVPTSVPAGVYGLYFQIGYAIGGEQALQSEAVGVPSAISIS